MLGRNRHERSKHPWLRDLQCLPVGKCLIQAFTNPPKATNAPLWSVVNRLPQHRSPVRSGRKWLIRIPVTTKNSQTGIAPVPETRRVPSKWRHVAHLCPSIAATARGQYPATLGVTFISLVPWLGSYSWSVSWQHAACEASRPVWP